MDLRAIIRIAAIGAAAGAGVAIWAARLLGLTARVELIEGLRLMLGTPPR